MRTSRTNLTEQKLVEIFNAKNPIGTRVRYTSEIGGAWRETVTRSEALLLGGHTACVFLAGLSSCVALSHVEVIKEEAAAP